MSTDAERRHAGEDPSEIALWATGEHFATLREIAAAGQATLDPKLWNFVEGGSGGEWTLRRNREAFDRWQFRPQSLAGIGAPDTTTSVLGVELSVPVLVAPFGFDRAFHDEGHAAVARGAQQAGAAMIVPVVSSLALEELRKVSPLACRFFQLVASGDEDVFVELGRRAAAVGYEALVVTVDAAVAGWRERSMEDRWVPDTAGVLGNFRAAPSAMAKMVAAGQQGWTWSHLGSLCERTGLPWVAKGVLTAEDASAALDVGASGVFVSNHGGRQLDGAPSALEALVDVVGAVRGRAVVGMDGGVRRGSDVLKALALGADVVAVGRPVVWGLAAAGEDGVARVLALLAEELRVCMTLCGVGSVPETDASLVRPVL